VIGDFLADGHSQPGFIADVSLAIESTDCRFGWFA
jgi:hypothetical protein